LHTALQRLQGIQSIVEIVFFLNVVPGLAEKLSRAQHNRGLGLRDLLA
jgi:hypothetical protein